MTAIGLLEILWVLLSIIGLSYSIRNFLTARDAWRAAWASQDDIIDVDDPAVLMTRAILQRTTIRGVIFVAWIGIGLDAMTRPGGTVLIWPPNHATLVGLLFLLTISALVFNEVTERRTALWCRDQWEPLEGSEEDAPVVRARTRRSRAVEK